MSDPYLTLGVPPDAEDARIHEAYLAAVKACPPERDPERFAQVREAYEAIRTRRDRLAHELFDHAAPSVREVLDRAAPVGAAGRPSLTDLAALLRGGR